ncbi:WD40 repeat-like protein [Exidia glandulosa HHB12029]|uniref:WD40 repeat-like protein n=1 Tax=Exidia glandulosa HHB12029 TaxID=1314781 RepID=A0A165MGY5_EXIGL|nr:WD40 repeat-like protein [Exidia glandulosa HHB12029]
MDEEQALAEENNKIINEEYKIWKKNAPFLYDVVVTHASDWPSLTVQWFPDTEAASDSSKPYTTHRLLTGTHTSGQSQEYVQIVTVHLPKRELPDGPGALERASYDDERGELGGHSAPNPARVQVTQRINHDDEVNRARYMPQNPDLIATRTTSGEVLVFDRTKHSSEPEADGVCRPQMRLVGQKGDGFGLAWSPAKAGLVASTSDASTMCYWDINTYVKGKTSVDPAGIFTAHTSAVGDVSWHSTRDYMLASGGDDKQLMIWDTREGDRSKPALQVEAHLQGILTVAFSPASEHLILTGSHDKTVGLWDLRSLRPSDRLHSFEQHADEVLNVAWSPHNPTMFASSSSDRRVHIWDLARIGLEQSPEDAEDGPPELVFIHGGHTTSPSDFCWAPGEGERWTLASVAEDNVLQVWAPSQYVWAGEEVRVHEDDLEEDDRRPGVRSKGGREALKEESGDEDDEDMEESVEDDEEPMSE